MQDLANFFASKNIKYSKIKDIYNPDILNKLIPLDRVLCAATFQKALLQSESCQKLNLKNLIKNFPYYSLCFDEGSSPLYKRYMFNIVLYNGQQSYLLDTFIQNCPFNSDSYSTAVIKTINLFELNVDKISAIVTDAAASMSATIRKLDNHFVESLGTRKTPFLHLFCISHSLHILCTYLFKAHTDINSFFTLLIDYLKSSKSIKTYKNLRDNYNINAGVTSYSETRWGKKISILEYSLHNWNNIKKYFEDQFEFSGLYSDILVFFILYHLKKNCSNS